MSGDGFLARERSMIVGLGRGDLKIAYGTHTNATASDTVVSGLDYVLACFATPDADASATANVAFCTATPGDQAGTPAAGSFLLKSWEADGTAATSFSDDINWLAIGY